MTVRVQQKPFDVGAEVAAHVLPGGAAGAAVHFVGTMRDINNGDDVAVMELEHYPGMTERELERVAGEAASRWQVLDTLVIHRYGELHPGEPIVLVAVWSGHRHDAFEACRYIIDILKTQAPFWKKETLVDGSQRWVEPHLGEGQPS
ncbi:molybdenum cofactor biosynthesis protein MoaE [Thiohalorhabdus sp.]|uniref:molybdenum cofactor biosynthesis protein MoaE n=1 Tax=Thiohalorhabdus sp. TaxID=3094134 RepID=UPI002FC3DFF2